MERFDNNTQLLREMRHEVTVKMRGASLKEVTGMIFQTMRKQLFREIEQPIIQMEAQEVYFEQVDVHTTTERFMFLFWPREKKEYTVTARIVVKVKYLELEEAK